MTSVYEAERILKKAKADEKYQRDRIRRERQKHLRIERDAKKRGEKHEAAVLRGLQPFLREGVTVEYDAYNCVSFSGPGLPTVAFSAEGGDGTTFLRVGGLD